jgi:type IV secretion system protein VirB4
MDDALAVISASTDNIELLHVVLEQQARVAGVAMDQLCPEQWLDVFHARRRDARERVTPVTAHPSARFAGAAAAG